MNRGTSSSWGSFRRACRSLGFVLLGLVLSLSGLVNPARAGTPAPFAPAGHLETSLIPAGQLAAGGNGMLFVCARYGFNPVYRSLDGGHMWETLCQSEAQPSETRKVNVLALSPDFARDGVCLALHPAGKFHLSTDWGRTWHIPAGIPVGEGSAAAFSPAFSIDRTVLAAVGSYVSTLVRSTDGGEHWSAINRPPRQSAIEEIVFSPYFRNDHTLFVCLQDRSLWRSIDSGSTWVRADSGLATDQGNWIKDLDAAALGNGVVALFVATQYAMVVTFNGGNTWYLVSRETFERVHAAPDFGTSHELYGLRAGDYQMRRTIDWGEAWTDLMPGTGTFSLAFSPSYRSDGTAYAITQYYSGPVSLRLWVSHDRGNNWSLVSSRPNATTMLVDRSSLTVSPTFELDGTIFAVPTLSDPWDRFLRTTDGGRSWTAVTLPGQVHDISMSLALSSTYAQDHTVWLTMDNQLYRSTDGGDHWGPYSTMPIAPCYLWVSPDFAHDHTLFAANQATGLYRSTNSGLNWASFAPAVGNNTYGLTISPNFATDRTLFYWGYYEAWRSTNGGVNWTKLPKPGLDNIASLAISNDYAQDHTVFATVNSTGSPVYRSTDGGATWVNVTGGFHLYEATTVAVSPHFDRDNTVLIGQGNGPCWISEDRGEHWFPLQGNAWDLARNHAALAYENGRLLPLASTPGSIFRYSWPTASVTPAQANLYLPLGGTDPVRGQIRLTASDNTGGAWQAESNAPWLSLAQPGGMLSDPVTPLADPVQVDGSANGQIMLHVYWSRNTVEEHVVPAKAEFRRFLWLPAASRSLTVQASAQALPHPDLVPFVCQP